MNRPCTVLAMVALLSACVAEDDPNTTSTANQQSSVSPVSANSSASEESVSSTDNGGQSSSAISSTGDDDTSSASSDAESSVSTSSESVSSSPVSSASSLASSSAHSLAVSSRSSAAQESSSPLSSSHSSTAQENSSSLPSSQSSSISSSQSSSEPEVSLVARDLHYSVNLGGTLSVDAEDGVMSNDDVVPGVYVEIVSEPEQGRLTLNADGSFTYIPTGDAGVDYFTYRLTDGSHSDTAEVSISIHSTVSGSKGFTPIIPSEDSRIIYVSSSEGDDSNDCLSPAEPCASLAEGADKMREGFPDHLYLKRGDVWRGWGLNDIPSGRSISEPAVVAFYGDSGPRPKLENEGTSRLGIRRYIPETDPRWQGESDNRRKVYMSYVHIIGLEFYNYRLDPDHPEFTGGDASATINLLDDYDHILFEDNKFNFTKVNAHEFQEFSQTNLTFRRNIWNGYYVNTSSYSQNPRPSNIYAGVEGLKMIENVLDHGGWHATVPGAGGNMYNHNIYLREGLDGEDVVIRGNIITRGSSHGIQMRSGGLAEENFFGRNAVSLLIGYKDPLMYDGVRAHAINNVISEGHSMVKGVDACSFNNSCSRAVWGLQLDLRGGNANWETHGNIVSKLDADDQQWRNFWGDDPYQLITNAITTDDAIDTSNNIAWKWSLDPEDVEHSYPDPERTLADYNAYLGGQRSFDAFMNVALNRPLQTWDERYTAYAINDYIREGFGR